MTWFKNSIKLLVVVIAFVCVATTQQTSAKSILDVYNSSWRNCNNGTFTATELYYNNVGVFRNGTDQYLTNYKTWVNTNIANNTSFNSSQSCSYTANTSFSFLKATKSNDFISIDFYNNVGNLTFSKFGYEHTYRNGETVLLNNIWFGHGFFVLYNDDLSHTLQVFPESYAEDLILFTDPLDSSLSNANIDNFFLIDVINKKAWGMKLLVTNIDPLFKGDTTNYNIKEFPFTSYYKLTEQANTTPFPKFSSYMNSNNNFNGGTWDRFSGDTGFAYIKQLNYEPPIFDSDDNNSNSDINSPTYNTDLINYYNSCVNKGENLRKGLQLLTMCKNQDPNIDADNIIIDTGLNYTGTASYCLQLDNFIVNAYNTYSGNWNNGLVNDTAKLQDVKAPFNDLIFSWYYQSVFLDENHNISGLPVGNSWCSVYSNEVFIDDNKTFIEKVADDLENFFGTGVAGKYIESVNEHSSFSGLIASIKDGTTGYFNEYFFSPFQDMFNSGYNAFNSKFGFESCNTIQSNWGFLQLGDYLVYIFAGVLLFIFLLCF